MNGLFTVFERKPDMCQAVYVTEENADRIARYYATSGYDAAVHRVNGETTIVLTRDGERVTISPGQALVYGHPPTVADYEEFCHVWRREAKYEARYEA